MKKLLWIFVILILIIAGGLVYILNNADEIIRAQIEKQGSHYLQTPVTVETVTLSLKDGRMAINGLSIANPVTYSDDNAFHLNEIAVDIGGVLKQPYRVDEVLIDAAEVLYEVDASGKANLIVLKDNLQSQLPSNSASSTDTSDESTEQPLVIIDKVTVANTRLRINFEQMDTSQLDIEQKVYDVTLPTFHTDPIGGTEGIPADQAGVAIFNSMLDNLIVEAKAQAKAIAEEKAKEKLDKEKDKLMEKARDKLKGLLDN